MVWQWRRWPRRAVAEAARAGVAVAEAGGVAGGAVAEAARAGVAAAGGSRWCGGVAAIAEVAAECPRQIAIKSMPPRWRCIPLIMQALSSRAGPGTPNQQMPIKSICPWRIS